MTFTGLGDFSVWGIYQENGLYQAKYVPTIAGVYQVNVKLLGVDISGSPYNIVVLPGEISSLNSHTTITLPDIAQLEAGTTYLFVLQLVDIYNNELIEGSYEDEIEVLALY